MNKWFCNSLFLLSVYVSTFGFLPNGVLAQVQVVPKGETSRLPRASTAELANAKAKLQRVKSNYQTKQKLAKRGSVSQSQLSQARLELQVAELEFDSLTGTPGRQARNQVKVAELRLSYAQQRYAISKKLFASGSISELRHRRIAYHRKFAELELRKAVGEISSDATQLLIARLQADLAQTELNLATKLYRKRSLTKTSYQLLLDRLREAEQALAELEAKQEKQKQAIDDTIRT